ncbi:hypothetical protein [Pedobacter sp. UYP1]|uniref:hypothetical protein n=1 Tax=Pedobacter sp. UYP1 TaxID=1756396 RepID=UPI00339A8098
MKKLLFLFLVVSVTCLVACKKDAIDKKATLKPKGEVAVVSPAAAYDYQKAIVVKRTLNPGLSH